MFGMKLFKKFKLEHPFSFVKGLGQEMLVQNDVCYFLEVLICFLGPTS